MLKSSLDKAASLFFALTPFLAHMRAANSLTVTSDYSRHQVADCFGVEAEDGGIVHNGLDPVFPAPAESEPFPWGNP